MQKLSRPIVFAAAGVAVVAMTGCGKSEKGKKGDLTDTAGKHPKSKPSELVGLKEATKRPVSRGQHLTENEVAIQEKLVAFGNYAQPKLDDLFNKVEAVQTSDAEKQKLLEEEMAKLMSKMEELAERAKTDQSAKLDAMEAKTDQAIKKFQEEVLAQLESEGIVKKVQGVIQGVTNKVASLTSSQENLEQQLEAAKKDVAAAQAKVEAMGEQLQNEMQGRGQMDEEAQQKMIEALEAKIQPLLDDVEKAKKRQDAIEAQQKQQPPVAPNSKQVPPPPPSKDNELFFDEEEIPPGDQ